jgi:hypothetical protein
MPTLQGHQNHRSGSASDGRKRFKCKACKKTFNAYTNTPLARLHMPEKHIANAKYMVGGLSVRDMAKMLDVNPKTAFLWRHRFLIKPAATQPAALSGVVEADETFFLESYKGQRGGLPCPAKVRGTAAVKPGLSKEQIPVIVARDRSTGATMTAKIDSRSAKHIGEKLIPVLSTDTLLFSDGARAYGAIGRKIGIKVESVPVGKKKKKGAPPVSATYHLNNVNSYDGRLKGWMYRFKGVATKNLDVYLGWHRMLDKDGKTLEAKDIVAESLAYR